MSFVLKGQKCFCCGLLVPEPAVPGRSSRRHLLEPRSRRGFEGGQREWESAAPPVPSRGMCPLPCCRLCHPQSKATPWQRFNGIVQA